MEIETVGENAGKVWRNLNENRGEISIQELRAQFENLGELVKNTIFVA